MLAVEGYHQMIVEHASQCADQKFPDGSDGTVEMLNQTDNFECNKNNNFRSKENDLSYEEVNRFTKFN